MMMTNVSPARMTTKPQRNYIQEYHDKIKSGEITVGSLTRKVYDKVEADLAAGLYFLDLKKANKAVRFIENFCHHTKGELAPGLIKLELWQKALVSMIFGLVNADGYRQFKEIFVVTARKCGKSLLDSGIAMYMSFCQGEQGADCYFLAPKLDQAKIVESNFCYSVEMEPALKSRFKKLKYEAFIPETRTMVKAIAFSEKKSDGYNPYFVSCDEVAAWKGEFGIRQYGVMSSAMGARREPMMLSITTANYESGGIYDELMSRSTAWLDGKSSETRLLPVIYMIDDVSKWYDINELKKSIPNLDVSISREYIENEIAKAKDNYAAKVEFLTKFCNVKQNSVSAWLPSHTVAGMFEQHNYTLNDFRGCYALVGVDLSQTTDLTAVVTLIERDGITYSFSHFWLPAQKVLDTETRDNLPYGKYVDRGWMSLSGENYIDYHDVYDYICGLITEYEIYPLVVGYDRYSSQYLVNDLQNQGFRCESVIQGGNLTGVLLDMEGMIKDKTLVSADQNEIYKIHLLNAGIKIDEQTNRRKLIKIARDYHIDGVAALSDAMCMRRNYYSEMPQLQNTTFEV